MKGLMASLRLSFLARRGIGSLLLLAMPHAFAQQFPTGWRRPTAAEMSDDWRKKSSTKFFVVKGDFDADGKQDLAELFVEPTTRQFALFARLSGAGSWQQLNAPIPLDALNRFGIDLVGAVKYETACEKGYGDYACEHGEPNYLILTDPAIDFIYTESSDSIYYWNPKSKKFVDVLMSD
jgi:hypothetical protein